MQERTQPWQDEALQLLQVVDGRLKELKKRENEVLQKTVGPTTEANLEEVHGEEKRVIEILPQYDAVYNGIIAKIKGIVVE